MGKFRSGNVYRYPAHRSLTETMSDGLPNYFFETALPGAALPLLEKGINQIARNRKAANSAYPAILIASSPQSRGTSGIPGMTPLSQIWAMCDTSAMLKNQATLLSRPETKSYWKSWLNTPPATETGD